MANRRVLAFAMPWRSKSRCLIVNQLGSLIHTHFGVCLYAWQALGLLTLSAILTGSSECLGANKIKSCSSSRLDLALFFFSLYLVALAEGGHKPCVEAFGADQFDEQDPVELKAKSSFFNWWYFGLCAGTSVTLVVVVYIQDNLNWSLGFGIPCISMVVALVIFLLGTTRYRYSVRPNEKGPFVRIRNVFVAAMKNRKREAPAILPEEDAGGVSPTNYKQFK